MPTRRSSFGADCAHCGKELIITQGNIVRSDKAQGIAMRKQVEAGLVEGGSNINRRQTSLPRRPPRRMKKPITLFGRLLSVAHR
jgi:hypothetical protein